MNKNIIVSKNVLNCIQCIQPVTVMPNNCIILHLQCVYFKHRKVTICPTIAELRLPVSQPPPHWESFLFVRLDFPLCKKCALQRVGESGSEKGSWVHGWLVSHVLDIKVLITVLKALCLPLRKALLGIFYCLP